MVHRTHFQQSKAKVKKRTSAENLPRRHKGQAKYKSGNKKRKVETEDEDGEVDVPDSAPSAIDKVKKGGREDDGSDHEGGGGDSGDFTSMAQAVKV